MPQQETLILNRNDLFSGDSLNCSDLFLGDTYFELH